MCDSSFIFPAKMLCNEFREKTGIDPVITANCSEFFLPLLKAGKEGDILITRDPFIKSVYDYQVLAANAEVGFISAVLAVRKGNPRCIKSIEDLTADGVKVGLVNPQYSDFGEKVFRLLESKSLKDAVLKNAGKRLTKDDTDLANFLKLGAVDAVIMSSGVAKTFEDSVEIIRIPGNYQGPGRIHVIGLNYSESSMAVMQFVEFARDRGSDIFAKHGYAK